MTGIKLWNENGILFHMIAKPSVGARVELYSTIFTIFHVWLHVLCSIVSLLLSLFFKVNVLLLIDSLHGPSERYCSVFFFNRKRFFLPSIFKFSFSRIPFINELQWGFFFYFLVVKSSLSLHKMYRWRVQLTRLNNKNIFSILFYFLCVSSTKSVVVH